MARNVEAGIDYFPLNTDIIHNSKVKLVVAEFGPKAWAVLLPLYCKIYREKGYWIDWFDEDSKLLFAQDECKTDLATVREIVNGCIRRFLFDKEVFDMFGILTSDRIQENYLEATKRRQSVDLISEFLVISNIKSYNVNIIALNVNIIHKKVNIGTQSRVKESKRKESKGDGPDQPTSHTKDLIKDKQEAFVKVLQEHLETYGRDLVNSFYKYWAEPNKSKTKLRWELEKTWDLRLRLSKWRDNEDKFNKNR